MTEGAGRINEKRRADRAALIIAAGLLVIAAVVAWDASRLGTGGAYARIGPQTIPYVIAICLAGLGAWTIFEALRGDFPEREEQEYRPVLWIIGGLVAQIVLLRIVGFSIATGALFGLVATGLGKKPLWLSIPIGIVLSLIVWIAFAKGLSLSLPAGPIENAIVAAFTAITNPGASAS
jgi:putative tricarboxylic transport membrane protein